MKTEYTQAQQEAVKLYLWHKRRFQELEAQAEELLSEGNYTLRERILKDADHQQSHLAGMRDMAAALGFPKAALLKAVRAAEKDSPGP